MDKEQLLSLARELGKEKLVGLAKELNLKLFHGYKVAAIDLAKQGWYLPGELTSPQMTIILTLHADKYNINDIEKVIIAWLTDIIDLMGGGLIRDNPERKEFIQDAIWAHQQQKYTLSTVAFLQQADGISKEYTGTNLFRKPKKADNVHSILKKLSDLPQANPDDNNLLKVIFYPYHYFSEGIETHAVYKSNNDINRGEILHGNDLNYHTEINSLKALSLLASINLLLKRHQKLVSTITQQ